MASVSNKNGRSEFPIGAPAMKYLSAQFTKRDLMLYALGIGCCNESTCDKDENDRELRFVYERHPRFEAFPTFLLALTFIAGRPSDGSQSSFGIRPFPPESMNHSCGDRSTIGILPKEFLKSQEDMEEVQNLPLLHMSQSLILHDKIKFSTQIDQNNIDPPTQIYLQSRILFVKPRSIGTFVTSETKYYQDGSCIATAQMGALILGLNPDVIVPLETPTNYHLTGKPRKMNQSTESSFRVDTPTSGNKNECEEKTVLRYRIPKNAALLYRLAGDYNPIHVEADILGSSNHLSDNGHGHNGKSEPKTQGRGAVLHGLCTMGYALRTALQHADHHHMNTSHGGELQLAAVRCNFVKPVYVGDSLRVEVWDEIDCTSRDKGAFEVCFRVYRGLSCVKGVEKRNDDEKHSEMVVDNGNAQFCLERPESAGTVSRL